MLMGCLEFLIRNLSQSHARSEPQRSRRLSAIQKMMRTKKMIGMMAEKEKGSQCDPAAKNGEPVKKWDAKREAGFREWFNEGVQIKQEEDEDMDGLLQKPGFMANNETSGDICNAPIANPSGDDELPTSSTVVEDSGELSTSSPVVEDSTDVMALGDMVSTQD
ncbi:hypothetical protein G7Z17_g13204 [Cylindrodendrum hubeiense]|uniref:Uncharacterized protein n=1 Tax=Cylindrodendrum hubeiense TaxID=595255 RepID=A0A9P5L9T2_9HYPO|nr:hypothetical protein G7Z17_g13204 [Cylindrodendrum hubeiense]